jgi:hypothetical protein
VSPPSPRATGWVCPLWAVDTERTIDSPRSAPRLPVGGSAIRSLDASRLDRGTVVAVQNKTKNGGDYCPPPPPPNDLAKYPGYLD